MLAFESLGILGAFGRCGIFGISGVVVIEGVDGVGIAGPGIVGADLIFKGVDGVFCCGSIGCDDVGGGRGSEGGAADGLGGVGTESGFRSVRRTSIGGVLSRGIDGVTGSLSSSFGSDSWDRSRGSSGGGASGEFSG